MGRPLKKGLKYFNIDCVQEDNLNYVEAKHGILGYGVLVKLWRKIYMVEGYYTQWNDKNIFLFAREIGVDAGLISDVVNSCFQEEIFNRQMFEKHQILTSHGIQKRYIKIVTEAKRKDTEVDKNYSLLNETPEEKGFTPEEIPKTPEDSTQKKEKESKEKERKENNVAPDKPVPPKKIGKVKEEIPDTYWHQLVDTWFVFNEKNFSVRPSFDLQEPKHFKNLIIRLKKRAAGKKIEWSQDNAMASLTFFLNTAFNDEWLKNHFQLSNLLEQFDSVFIRLSLKGKPKNDQPAAQTIGDQDIDFLLQRYLEGDLDKKLIREEHYLYLEKQYGLSITEEEIAEALKIRINNLNGTNQASELRLLHDYQFRKETDLTKQDRPRITKLARRLAVLKYFENKRNDHQAAV